MLVCFDLNSESVARALAPLYATTLIDAKIPITTITINSSTIVKPLLLLPIVQIITEKSGRAHIANYRRQEGALRLWSDERA